MRIGARRLVRSVLALLVLSVLSWEPAPGKEVPLQSPIFRTQRLDFSPTAPPFAPYLYGQPLSIQSARAGDFNGDGNAEILVFNDPCFGEAPGAYILHLTPGGIIESATGARASATCIQSLRMRGEKYAAGDFDGDGLLDFASWGSGTLFLQRPGGEFVESPFSLPLDPVQVALDSYVASADLNRDGIPDVVIAQQIFTIEWSDWFPVIRESTNLYVFLADGQGGFVRSQKITAPADPAHDFRLYPAALKDFTGDGVPDYLGYGTGPQGAWEILPGDGAGHLLTPDEGLGVPLPAPDPHSSENPIAGSGDLNGDGLPDLILRDTFAVLLSTGVAQFTCHPQLPAPPNFFGSGTYSIQDVDGDGREDLQIFYYDDTITHQYYAATYLGEPDGTLGPPQQVSLPLVAQGSLRMRWDEDPYPDTVYYGWPANYFDSPPPPARSLSVFLSEGGPGRDQISLPLSWTYASPRSVGDFDGDGEKDLLLTGGIGGSRRIVIYRGDGHGGFLPLPEVQVTEGGSIASAMAADFNHDGRDDVVVLTNPSTTGGQGGVALYLGQPPGEPPALLLTRMAGSKPVKAAAADLDGDGNLDLLVADWGALGGIVCTYCVLGGTVSAYMGQGGGILGDPTVVIDIDPPAWYPGIADIQVGRVNSDGIPDLLILFSHFSIYGHTYGTWAIGLGDGRFDWPYVFDQASSSSMLFPLLPPADVNGDGLPDLGLSPTTFQYSSWYPQFGTFLGNEEEDLSLFGIPSPCCYNPGRFIDLDGDGYVDLTGVGPSFKFLQFGAGTGTGDFVSRGPVYAPSGRGLLPATYFPFMSPAPLFGDFNDDGREDVVVWDDSAIHLLLNRSGRVASDPAESLQDPVTDAPRVDPEIDLAEIQARVGSYDFTGSGIPQGALVFTLSLNDWVPPAEGEVAGGVAAIRDGSAPARGGLRSRPGRPGPTARERNQVGRPGMKSGKFHLFLNFGEPLLDGDGDGTLDLSIANAIQEPGLEGIPLADVSLNLRLDGGGPLFTGLRNVNLFSSVDRERGIATFVVPFEDLLSAMTPAERFAMDRGDGTGRLFLWAVSQLYGDKDRVPDTDDGADPTIRSEVREFRFPLQDLRVTPYLFFGDVLITSHLDGPLTLANHGASPVTVNDLEMPDTALSLPASPPFAVPAAGRIPMRLRYAPTEHAIFSGDLSFLLDDPGQPTIRMRAQGRGVAPIAQVSAELVDFGSAPVGLASGYQYLQVKNVGDATLYVDWEILDPEAQFSFYYPNSYYLPPPEERNFAVSPNGGKGFYWYFRPNRLGLSEATFRMHTNDPLHPQIDVVLRGTGTPPEPRISIGSGCFGATISNVPLGEEKSITCPVSNQGSGPLHILSVTSSHPDFTAFVEPTAIDPGSAGKMTVTYRPTAWGLFSSTIAVGSDDPTHPTVSGTVQGRAFEPPPLGHVSQTLLDFGEVHQGDSSVLAFEISNTGAGPLWLTGSSPVLYSSCAFQADLSLPGLVLPGESLTVHVTLTADIDKTLCSSFHFHTNDPALSTVTITLKAKILSPSMIYEPASLSFPATPVGSSSKLNLAVANIGAEALWVTKVSFGRPEFSLGGPLPPPIPVGGVANLPIVFTPATTGTIYSYVTIFTNDLSHRQVTISLYATGVLATSLTTPIEMLGE